MRRRSFKRFTRRLEAEFLYGKTIIRGISSNLSERGLFIRTRRCLETESPIEIVLYLPDGRKSRLRGIVRRAIKTDSALIKNGMGIELAEYDENYMEFLRSSVGELKAEPLLPVEKHEEPLAANPGPRQSEPESQVLRCPHCGVKNKVPSARLALNPRCGKCKEPLTG